MKSLCIALITSIMSIMSIFCMDATQELAIHILVDQTRKMRRDKISSHDLDKWGRFYGEQALPFEYYFPVVSAMYEDCLGDGIIFHKNLMSKLPSIIRNDQNLDKDKRKEYFFPKYIAKTFIEQLQMNQASGKKFQHKFYERKDLNKVLSISYTIEYQEQHNQTGAEAPVILHAMSSLQPDRDCARDCVVDLMMLLSLIIG